MTAPLLSVKDLSKAFGGVQAVNLVSFELVAGELLGVIGPNGSGKTTLVNLVTGFVKPTAGRVLYQGKDITGWPPYRVVRLGVARTFQMVKPFHQLPAYKNMIIPLYSPRVKRMTEANTETGTRWPSTCWRKWVSSATPMWPTSRPARCPRVI